MIDHFGAPWVTPETYRLRDDARRFETWENNYAARLGLGVAVDYAQALALEEWLAAGGTMVIVGSLNFALYQEPQLARYLPARVTGVRRSAFQIGRAHV